VISVLVLKSSMFYFLSNISVLYFRIYWFPYLFRCLFCYYYLQIDGVSFLLLNYPTLLDHWGLPSSTAVKLSRKIFYLLVCHIALQSVSHERKVAHPVFWMQTPGESTNFVWWIRIRIQKAKKIPEKKKNCAETILL
jgi:hypothetical protein